MNSNNISTDSSTDKARTEGRREADSGKVSTGAVDVHGSETGSDTQVGHTPGKAEGVTAPEAQGNE